MRDVDQLRQDFSSPFGAKLVEVEEEEKFVAMILDDNETEVMASIRMREIWARSLAWKEEGKMQLLADDEANEVVSCFFLGKVFLRLRSPPHRCLPTRSLM